MRINSLKTHWDRNPFLQLKLIHSSFFLDDFFSFVSFSKSSVITLLNHLKSFFMVNVTSFSMNFKNLFIYGFIGSLIFFIVSNFGVWALGSPGVYDIAYEKNLNGLVECYILAIPFFGNTFLTTVIFAYPAIFIYKLLPTRSSSR